MKAKFLKKRAKGTETEETNTLNNLRNIPKFPTVQQNLAAIWLLRLDQIVQVPIESRGRNQKVPFTLHLKSLPLIPIRENA